MRAQDGIARYTRSLVDALLATDELLELFLFASTAVGMPVHPRVTPVVHGMTPRWWRVRLLLAHFAGIPVMRGMPKVDLFHATDFVFPPTSDRVPIVVVSLHDITTITSQKTHTYTHRVVTSIFLMLLKNSPHHVLVPSNVGLMTTAMMLGIPQKRMTVVPYGVGHNSLCANRDSSTG